MSVPMLLFETTFPVPPPIEIPTPLFPEHEIAGDGVQGGEVRGVRARTTPPATPSATVPEASVPMKLFVIVFCLLDGIETTPAMTLRSPGSEPPTVFVQLRSVTLDVGLTVEPSRRQAHETADQAVLTVGGREHVVEIDTGAGIEREAADGRPDEERGRPHGEVSAAVDAGELDQDHRVVANGQVVGRGARLRVAIDRDRFRYLRQGRDGRDGLNARARDVEGDRVGPALPLASRIA